MAIIAVALGLLVSSAYAKKDGGMPGRTERELPAPRTPAVNPLNEKLAADFDAIYGSLGGQTWSEMSTLYQRAKIENPNSVLLVRCFIFSRASKCLRSLLS